MSNSQLTKVNAKMKLRDSSRFQLKPLLSVTVKTKMSNCLLFFSNKSLNKKVLLRERKRHTARRVVSTPSVVLTGYPLAGYPPILTWLRGYPTWVPPWQGTPPGRVPPCPDLAGEYPIWVHPWQGTPRQGTLLGRVPPGRVPPPGWTWQGTPLGVCPMEFWVMLQSIMGYGYPPQVSAPWHSG